MLNKDPLVVVLSLLRDDIDDVSLHVINKLTEQKLCVTFTHDTRINLQTYKQKLCVTFIFSFANKFMEQVFYYFCVLDFRIISI